MYADLMEGCRPSAIGSQPGSRVLSPCRVNNAERVFCLSLSSYPCESAQSVEIRVLFFILLVFRWAAAAPRIISRSGSESYDYYWPPRAGGGELSVVSDNTGGGGKFRAGSECKREEREEGRRVAWRWIGRLSDQSEGAERIAYR